MAAVIALGGWIANAAAMAPYARGWAAPESEGVHDRTWTFVSINLLQGNREPEKVIRYLRQIRPDVVVFQEVSDRLARELEPLHEIYPFRLVRAAKDQFGMALFAREQPQETDTEAVGNRVGDIAMFARWKSASRTLALAAVHPDKPDEQWKTVNRAQYLGRIARWVEESQRRGESVIVLGDFNATPWSQSMQSFLAETGLRNANDGSLFGASWNVWQPQRLLIDHVLFSREWVLHQCVIGPDVGSDHRPMLVRASLSAP